MSIPYTTKECVALLESQKKRLDNARRRKGEIPDDSQKPQELVESHWRTSKWIKEKSHPGDNFIVDSSIIAPYYPPSTASPGSLTKMHIKELQLETHHRGSYLILRTNVPPIKVAGVIISVMRDELHNMVMTSHHYVNAESLFLGGIFMIKEPYFTIRSDGDYHVRVDHVTDMIHVCAVSHWIPSNLRTHDDSSSMTSDWKRKGDRELDHRNYIAAVMA